MYKYRRLYDLRTDNDKTQKEIAKILNITYQQYQLYESGKREIPVHKLIILCKYYNISADYILGLTNEPRKLEKKGTTPQV